MKAAWIRLFSLVLVVFLLAGCAALPVAQTGPEEVEPPVQAGQEEAEPPAPADAFEPVTLKAGYLPIGSYLPLYVAIAKGYFEEQGITLEMQTFRTGAEMIAPLSLGQLDIGGGEVGTAFFNAINQKMIVRIVLPMGFLTADNSYLLMAVRKDLFDSGEFDSLVDQAGKKIGVNAVRGVTEWFAVKALEAGGLTLNDAELVVIPFPEMAQALENKAIDATWIQYPVAAVITEPGPSGEEPSGVRLIGADEVTNEPHITSIYFGERLLRPENREAGVRFCMAMLKAYRFIQDEDWMADEDVIQTMSEITQSSPELLRTGIYPGFDPNGRLNIESLADMQNYYVKQGYTEYGEVIAMEQVIDESFWQEALERLGEVQP